ncbi:MAG TPA: glycosyltransferase [Anaeromyxobacter sp.]|nr:glycosyltransferase [Anaeromyxobacter sp.]
MRLSLVVLTCERPDALELVLRGVARQRVGPFEVIVTEDGAASGTRACVEALRPGFPVPLLHLTQARAGRGACRARNRGVAAARGDYVVFLDGDMVPGPDFVADHLAFARRGCFAQGSRVLLSEARTRALLATRQLDVPFFAGGLERRRHLVRAPRLRDLWGSPHQRRDGVKSCNFAFWRDDLVALNGFEERLQGWGLEDAELAQRAFHLGLRRRDLRMGAVALHLWHPPSALQDDNPNWVTLREVERSGRTRCVRGLSEHL